MSERSAAGNPIRLAIHGAAGRMGRRLIALGTADGSLRIVAAIDRSEHAESGRDAGHLAGIGPIDVPLSDQLPSSGQADAVIDFSTPAAAERLLDRCVQERLPLVLATTGWSAQQREEIERAAQTIPLVFAPNMSLAVNLTMKLAQITAETLRDHPSGVDVEIIERHHRFKADAPSGTALRFGELIAQQMGQTRHVHGREGVPGQRPADEIGYHALRVGDNPGEHTIVFGMLGETIELRVAATNRDSYAVGALQAAKFVARQEAGLYSMNDVLGL